MSAHMRTHAPSRLTTTLSLLLLLFVLATTPACEGEQHVIDPNQDDPDAELDLNSDDPDAEADPDADSDLDAADVEESPDTSDDPDVEPDTDDNPVNCLLNSDCDEDAGNYCQREPGCGSRGTCRPLSELLDGGCGDFPTEYCSCDGVTRESPDTCITEPYNHLGSCDLEPGQCFRNDDCPQQGHYCNRPVGCQERGTCEEIPEGVICLTVLTPYCDCDGQSQVSPSSCVYDPMLHEGECNDEI
jgi:hypothetical protein